MTCEAPRDWRGYSAAFLCAAAIAWSLAILTLLAASAGAQQLKPNEYQVKATYLYNFGKFVKWPTEGEANKSDSFGVCVLGQDPFGPILDTTLSRETLDGKPVVLKRIARAQDAADCKIVFVSSGEEKHLKEDLETLNSLGALTVSDMKDFARRGGMIQFTLEGERIRFEINVESAQNAKLVLSSELLKVAANIRKSAPIGD